MDKTTEPDEWLMGKVVQGEKECLAPLVRRYASSLLTYIHRMTGDRHRSEELFQDVCLAVWQKRKTFKLNRKFRPWLYTIALPGRESVVLGGNFGQYIRICHQQNGY